MAGATTVIRIILGTACVFMAVAAWAVAGLYLAAGYNRSDGFIGTIGAVFALAGLGLFGWGLRRFFR